MSFLASIKLSLVLTEYPVLAHRSTSELPLMVSKGKICISSNNYALHEYMSEVVVIMCLCIICGMMCSVCVAIIIIIKRTR